MVWNRCAVLHHARHKATPRPPTVKKLARADWPQWEAHDDCLPCRGHQLCSCGWAKATKHPAATAHASCAAPRIDSIGVVGIDLDDALLPREREVATDYLDLVVGMLSQRCWSQCHHSNALPDLFTGMFAPTEEQATACMDNARQLWESVLKAVRMCNTGSGTSALDTCLRDIFWKDHVFVKEVAVLLDRCEWSYDNPDARSAVWGYAGTLANTKQPNENVFNTLRDIQRKSKNKRINRHRAWHAANTSPFLQTSPAADSETAFRHFELPAEDLVLPLELSVGRVKEGIFTPAGHIVHQSVNAKELLEPERTRRIPWQPAGPLADRKASAAAALLRCLSPSDFRLECVLNAALG